jgi:hypothetical protein
VILKPSSGIGAAFGVTIFLGAFLLFQVQLVIGKYILPWYGGVPMVWTTCMLCFQLGLLAGYGYAHAIVRRLTGPAQRLVHLSVMALALAAVALLVTRWGVPLLPDATWKPAGTEAPVWHIVRLLAVSVGAPFFVAATTAPLLQSWFGTSYPRSSPYRLYALSNLGSLLALLTYPAVVEVWLPLRAQAWAWTGGFAVFAVGVLVCAWATASGDSGKSLVPRSLGAAARRGAWTSSGASHTEDAPALAEIGGAVWSIERRRAVAAPRARDWLLWLALSACPSALLLATTNYVSQEIAVIPFLWIVPLSLYLASWVLTFDSERWYVRGVWATLLALGVMLSTFVLERGVWAHLLLQIGVAAGTLFVACMVCHGELARTKPRAAYLTSFYLAITVGGAIGGAFVSLAAPVLFPGTWEYPLALWLVAALALVTFFRDRRSPLHEWPLWSLLLAAAAATGTATHLFGHRPPWMPELSDAWLFGIPTAVAVAGLVLHAVLLRRQVHAPQVAPPRVRALVASLVAVGLIAIGVALWHVTTSGLSHTVEHSRSFFGILHVEAVDPGGDAHEVRLRHGRIVHGKQYRAPDLLREPTAYYGRDSGVALAILNHPRRAAGLRVGVIGLGVGTLAAYGEAGDTFRFYELNPHVSRLAGPSGTTFTFVRDSKAKTEVVTGDARLSLEAELARGDPQRFDVLAVDAFSSDAIPAHLLTREAVAGYLMHVAPGGILALHITNRYVELKPVVRGLAKQFGLAYAFVSAIDGQWTWSNDWALLARDPASLALPAIADVKDTEPSNPPVVLWTDDYSNLLRLVRW